MMLLHHTSWLAWTLLLLVAALIAGGFVISPWVGIAAIGFAAFIVVMVMSFVIFAYGFNSITGLNMTPHSLGIEDGRMMVELADGKTIGMELSGIKPYKIYPGGVMIPFDGPRSGWLWVPPSAFPNDEDFRNFLKSSYKNKDLIQYEGNTE